MANSFTPQEIEQFLREFFDVVGARQYIGARYVPIFGRRGEDTVEWDDGAPYEPLTVVMHLGVSYVSRQYVPTGTPITDTDFWVETYRFNAQVEQYRQEVLGFQSQIDQIQEDYVPFPDSETYPKYGSLGQVLSTLADGSTRWEDPVVPSDAQAEAVITEWLGDHPEATTTVTDRSLTPVKLTIPTVGALQQEVFITNALPTFAMSQGTLTVSNLGAVFVRNQGSGGGYVRYAQTTTSYAIANGQVLVWNTSTETLEVVSAGARLNDYAVTLLWNHYGVIKGLWASWYYESDAVRAITPAKMTIPTIDALQQEVFFANALPTFAMSQGTLTVSNIGAVFVRNHSATGDSYVRYAQTVTSHEIANGQVLVWDASAHTLGVWPAADPMNDYAVTLLWNHYGVIKGLWASYYYESLLTDSATRLKTVNRKVMSRQGDGFGYPDNSLEAVGAALANGFRNIRVSTAHTSDGVWYATHSYEMQHNATTPCLTYKADGTSYTSDLDINTTSSTLLDTLNYKGRGIPTLESVLRVCSMYDASVTVEMKDDIAAGSVATSLVDLVMAYRPDAVFSGSTIQAQNVCNATNAKLNVAVIFHYSDSDYATVVANFITNDLAKTLRLDCYYGDTITTSQLSQIHEHAKLKLGGTGITSTQAKQYLEYVDVVEYNNKYSDLSADI